MIEVTPMPQNSEMSIRCGTDLVEVERISRAVNRLGQPFLDRIFTSFEQADCMPDRRLTPGGAASLAARFAAKEAVSKALGTGIWQQGVSWTDIAVRRSPDGAPSIELNGAALIVFESIGGHSIAISLSHEKSLALAFCVVDCRVPGGKATGDE